MEDIACEQERDAYEVVSSWVDQEFQERILALEERHLESQEWQAAMVAKAVEATGEDRQVLDTILDSLPGGHLAYAEEVAETDPDQAAVTMVVKQGNQDDSSDVNSFAIHTAVIPPTDSETLKS
ncbi:hypothetical protein Y1Q_0024505 [Alligator mississippiensis]|uniref:Uncharacterized protein n=1 Tax=Alligator mississippiensis TaxID=8496 RepID=A0A151NAN3_ALLMI|nr:hypothetical protein Y1Q_0024505 [Alligator mississippiensis]